MARERSKVKMGRPVTWTSLIVVSGILVYMLPSAASAMIYDRSAVLSGQVWRLLTGHWVHFSASHLTCDLAVLAAASWAIESRGYRCLPLLLFGSALAIGVALLVFLPAMSRYGGLSGIAMAAMVYMCLHARREPGAWRLASLAMLALAAGKLAFDFRGAGWMAVRLDEGSIHPVPVAHLVGAVCGLLAYFFSVWTKPGEHGGPI